MSSTTTFISSSSILVKKLYHHSNGTDATSSVPTRSILNRSNGITLRMRKAHCMNLSMSNSNDMISDQTPTEDNSSFIPPRSADSNQEQPCTYCQGEKIVECPVCEGRGYHGRTIPCYYCHGKKEIECPLCIDDIYKATWQPDANAVYEDDDDGDSDEKDKKPVSTQSSAQ